jgi:putative Mg2+ transporter-C (MgtC) family protein
MTGQFILSIFIAAMLGGAIGLEREYRSKEAGFRTHFLVGLGSALFMVLSMHGFDGFEAQPGVIIQRDPARMAAQVVSGIGFIGAGTIIFQKNVVKGLTTAAGLWVTSAIGMAAGVGMYDVAVAATVMVIVCLETMNFLHHRVFKSHQREYDADEKND